MSDWNSLYLDKSKPETFEELMALYEKLENKKIQLLADYRSTISFSMQNLTDLFSVIKNAPETNAKKRVEAFFTTCFGEEECQFIERRVEEYIR